MLIRNKFNGYSADGVRTYYFGGGGGGGDQTTTTELPEWARGYAQEALGRGDALSRTPYQTYGGDRFAGFSPLQLQTQQTIAGMGPAGQIGEASDLASLAGSRAFQAGQYTPGQYTGGTFGRGAAGFYMSPFLEQAMAPQLREAQRDSAILGTQQAGQAVKSGAFGGSRAGLLEAERQRNLGTQMGDIRARGYQTAYDKAADQFNQDMQRRMQAQQLSEQSRQFGSNIGLQGLNTAISAAGQLGTLGQTQFGQQKDILGMQKDVGAEQQALRQKGLDTAYQDFLNQQNYPYKQLGFFSDMIRGLPLGSNQTLYAGQPSLAQTAGSVAAGVYGANKVFGNREGGVVNSMAEGGSVTDERFVESALDKLSDQQLAQAEQVAMATGDRQRLAMIAEEKAMRASERRGLAGAFNQIPQEQQERMARGGIVAFEGGGVTSDDESPLPLSEQLGYEYRGLRAPEVRTPEQLQERRQSLSSLFGPGMTQQYMDKLAEDRAALASRREENKGLVALAAAQALSKGSGLRQGLANMFGAVGAEAGRLSKDVRESEQLIRRSEMTLAQAKQAREDGLNDKAMQLERQAYTDAVAAHNAKKTGIYEQQRLAQAKELDEARTAREETREEARTRRAETAAELAHNRAVAVAEIQAGRDRETASDREIAALTEDIKTKNPNLTPDAARAQAIRERLSMMGRVPGDVRAEQVADQLRAGIEKDINAQTSLLRTRLSTTKDPKVKAELQAEINAIEERERRKFPSLYPSGAAPTSAPAPSSGALPMPSKREDLKQGQTYSTPRGPATWDGEKFNLVTAK
jgi:hypothetical protein